MNSYYLTLPQCNTEIPRSSCAGCSIHISWMEILQSAALTKKPQSSSLALLCLSYLFTKVLKRQRTETSRGSNTQSSHRGKTSVSGAISITCVHAPSHGNCKATRFGLVLIHFRLCSCYWQNVCTGTNATTPSFESSLSASDRQFPTMKKTCLIV